MTGIDVNYTKTFKRFAIFKCKDCGLEALNPQLSEQEIGEYYPKHYYSYNTNPKKSIIQRIIERTLHDVMNKKVSLYTILFRHRLHKYPTNRGDGKNYLDVGCGDGQFFSILKNYGWNTQGFELGTPNHTGEIFYDTHIKNIPWNTKYDYITLWAVFEHLLDPIGYIKALKDIITDEGEMHIMIPNANSIYAKIFGAYRYNRDIPRHVYNYSIDSIKRLLYSQGLKPTAITYLASGAIPLSIYHFIEHKRSYKLHFLHSIYITLLFYPIDIIVNLCKSGDLIEITIKKDI